MVNVPGEWEQRLPGVGSAAICLDRKSLREAGGTPEEVRHPLCGGPQG